MRVEKLTIRKCQCPTYRLNGISAALMILERKRTSENFVEVFMDFKPVWQEGKRKRNTARPKRRTPLKTLDAYHISPAEGDMWPCKGKLTKA
jgi:hypothetical protein